MWVICSGDSVKGGVPHAHRKILQRCCCRDLKTHFQVPSSVSLLLICCAIYKEQNAGRRCQNRKFYGRVVVNWYFNGSVLADHGRSTRPTIDIRRTSYIYGPT